MANVRRSVYLPEELIRAVDELAGRRGRSRYVSDAVAKRLKRDRLGKAIRETAGALKGTPYEMTPQEVTAWVDALRSEETD